MMGSIGWLFCPFLSKDYNLYSVFVDITLPCFQKPGCVVKQEATCKD